MRLIGSFQTMVSQGRSGRTSSSDRGRSTSTGAGVVMGVGAPLSRHVLSTDVFPTSSLPTGPRVHRVRTPSSVPLVELASTTALLTDHYELTMVEAALRSGTASRRTVFEVFARQLPHGRR